MSVGAYKAGRVMPPLVVGIFMRALQMTVIGPSLIDIAHSINATLADVGWIMATYATGSLVAQPIVGRLSDAKGRKLVFSTAVAVFAAGSLMCALATSLPALIAGRVIQSLGAGGIQPAVVAIVGDSVPTSKQGASLGIIYAMFALAAATGSVIGGALIDGGRAIAAHHVLGAALARELTDFPWHLIFWINLPLALATLALGLGLPADRPTRARVGVDPGAIVLLAGFTAAIMLAASARPLVALVWLVVAGAAIVVLVRWERSAAAPLLDPTLFEERGPSLVYAIALLFGVPIFSVTMYAAAYLMQQFGVAASTAGFALLALAIPLGIGQGGGGVIINRIGARAVLQIGTVVLAAGDLLLGVLTGRVEVLAALALCGLGMGLLSAPPNVLIYRYVGRERRGAATGLMTMFGTSGAVTAPAVVSAFLNYGGFGAAQNFRLEFILAGVLAVACVPLIAMLPQPTHD